MSLNSTMVRLKQKSISWYGRHYSRSQFHYGSIKTLNYNEICSIEVMSQFHYGSIKTPERVVEMGREI